MRTHSLSLVAVALLMLAATGSLLAQAALDPGDPERISIDSLLAPDGSLRLDGSFAGSIDVDGFRMVLGDDGAPRFVKQSGPRLSAGPLDSLDSLWRSVPGDEFWLESFGPPGTNGVVRGLAIIDGELYVGGEFTITGNAIAFNIARWNGRKWYAVGGGIGGPVTGLAAHRGLLYAIGNFETAGGVAAVNIARYNPSDDKWSPLGVGVGITDIPLCLAFHDDTLYVGGQFDTVFTRAKVTRVGGVARWNGRSWDDVNGGALAGGTGMLGRITGIAIRKGIVYTAGTHYVDGGVTAALQFDGRLWTEVGGGIAGASMSVLATDEAVFYTTLASTWTQNDKRSCVRRWAPETGQWSILGGEFVGTLTSIATDGRHLYVGGDISSIGGIAVSGIARFDGSAWLAVGGGVADTAETDVLTMVAGADGLYVGGRFILAGTVSAHNVARWDGEIWHPLSSTFDRTASREGVDGSVHALAVREGRLYVGGDFLHAGGIPANRIAVWDGDIWSPLGSGIGGRGGFVRALAFGPTGDLYAGGVFEEAGGVAARGIARWDGTRWSAVGGGVSGATPYVFALHGTANTMIAAGAFTAAGDLPAARIAQYRFDTGLWSPLGSGLSGDSSEYVYATCLASLGDDLFVGGDFARAGDVRARRLARWDGTRWYAIPGGNDTGANALVSALTVHNGMLHAGGRFSSIGGERIRFLARLNGARWEALDTHRRPTGPVSALVSRGADLMVGGLFGFSDTSVVPNVMIIGPDSTWRPGVGVNGTVHALAYDDGVVYAGGDFTMAGPRKASRVAAWDDVLWTSIGADPSSGIYGIVRTISVAGSDVYIGGHFSAVGGIRARNIARWDGSRWRTLGRGRLNGVDGAVFALEPAGTSLFVGGAFTHAGADSVNYIARWDGTRWWSLGDGVSGVNPYVHALLVDGDDLYVGGVFTRASGLSANRIARWSIANRQWSILDSGVYGGSYYTYVSALFKWRSDLYVGGNFQVAGREPSANVARWDGSAWHTVGNGLNGTVYELIEYDGGVVACGEFLASGDTELRYIGSWDGTAWRPLANGLNRRATDMAVIGDELFVGGHFQLAGLSLAFAVARWNGSSWDNLGKGVQHGYKPGIVYGIAAGDSGLWVGGDFTVAGGRPSYYFGRWHRTGAITSAGPIVAPVAASAAIVCEPNPAAAHATLRLNLPATSTITVDVCDLSGTRRMTVFNGRLSSGDHRLPFPAAELTAGHYAVRVRGSNFEASTLLTIVR